MTRIFHVTPIKPTRDKFDWKVTTNAATKQYIAAQRANDDPDFQDRLPCFYESQTTAVEAAHRLAETYAPAQVVLHYRPTLPKDKIDFGKL